METDNQGLTLSQTTNFRLFQTKKSLQMTSLTLMKMAEISLNPLPDDKFETLPN